MRVARTAGTIVTLVVTARGVARAQRASRGGTGGDSGGRSSFSDEIGRRFDTMGDLKPVVDQLRDDAELRRNAGWALVSQLVVEAQRPAFEVNVETITSDEARRDADRRARMPRGGRP